MADIQADSLRPDKFMIVEPRPRAHLWVKDGAPTLLVIADAPDGMALDDQGFPILIFDPSFDLTVQTVTP